MTGGATTVELEEGEPPLVALTFDDGPRNSTTGRLLDGLALREVPATFFLVGNRIEGSEELIRRMAADGHQIGIHTFEHVVVSDLSRKDFDLQVGKTRALLAEILGDGEFWLRPPYGLFDSSVRKWADCPIILWSVDPEDWTVVGGPGGLEGQGCGPHCGSGGRTCEGWGYYPDARYL